MGIGKYNEECRSIVMKYSKEWELTVKRIGRWIDMDNDWKTLDINFMESVWWVFKQLFTKDQVYRGFRVRPPSFGLSIPSTLTHPILDYALFHGVQHALIQL